MRAVRTLVGVVIALALATSLAACERAAAPDPSTLTKGAYASSSVTVPFIRVIDGDTIAVKPTGSLSDTGYGEHSVRLLGIDAPEMHKTTDEAPDCGAQAATDHLADLLAGQGTVTLTFDPVSDHADRYGRSLAYVSVAGHDLNLEQAAGGFAEAWYPHGEPAPVRFDSYESVQHDAEVSGSGSWGTCGSLGR